MIKSVKLCTHPHLVLHSVNVILITEANQVIGKVHDPKFRMPVILDKNSEPFWLSKDISPADLLTLCKPYADKQVASYQVSNRCKKQG
jgi:putative SOS response-associated peptidase YedK